MVSDNFEIEKNKMRFSLKVIMLMIMLPLNILNGYGVVPTDTTTYCVNGKTLFEIHSVVEYDTIRVESWRYYVEEYRDSIKKLQKHISRLPIDMLPYNDDKRFQLSCKRFGKYMVDYLRQLGLSKEMQIDSEKKYSCCSFWLLICNNGDVIPWSFSPHIPLARLYGAQKVIDILDNVMQQKFLAPLISVIDGDGYTIRPVVVMSENK